MRPLPITLAVAALAVAVWAVPSLAAYRTGAGASTGSRTRATSAAKPKTTRTTVASEVLRASLAPSVPADPMIDGASPGALPWVLRSGDVVVAGGRLQLGLDGFLIPGEGTGPVKTVSASLYCNGSDTPAATTPAAMLSSGGHASIDAAVTLPKRCLAPIVLVHPNGQRDSYVAGSGWTS